MNRLDEYADLIVRVGANVQKGQTVVINCNTDCVEFARMITSKAYDAGAREVVVRWADDEITHMKYLRAEDGVFDEMPEWLKSFCDGYADKQAAMIHIIAGDPHLLSDVSPDRTQRYARVSGKALEDYYNKQMSNYFPWCIVSLPTRQWAERVFPDMEPDKALEKLWDAVLKAVCVGGGKAVERWNDKLKSSGERAKKLTGYQFKKLVYKNSLGTDLTVELPEKHSWTSCGEKAANGVTFVANMPSEEIFTLPKKDGVNGVLYASKPLILDGRVISGIKFVIKDGKIVEFSADDHEDALEKALDIDEGSRYLGEVALVPYHSPISEMGILFHETLFDENASCHFAFGKAYPCFTDAAERSDEELKARGMNDSIEHEDFMVGTEDLSVTGILDDGTEIPVFINGDFAF